MPKKICVSHELAKQLKEAGYPQDGSVFSWYKYSLKSKAVLLLNPPKGMEVACLSGKLEYRLAAPTTSEIELPEEYFTFKIYNDYFYGKINNKITNENNEEEEQWEIQSIGCEYVEADARAKMWFYLKSKNLI